MVYCNHCKEEVEVDVDEANGFSCCTSCGRVLDEVAFSNEVTFTKGAGGVSTADGQFVSDVAASRGLGRISGGRLYGYQLDSHERSLNKGRSEVAQLVDRLRIAPRDDTIEAASRLYALALQRNFTRGRRTALVAAACLYIVCRQDSKPFMLIDFSDALQVNVFTLGAVFLHLCKLLRLEEHPMFQRPVDPSLYLHRFANRLGVSDKFHAVTNTALRLVASMKRDWMQTGRRPSGICGAALFISAHIHGIEKSKRDVVNIVHVGEATLAKRVKEFALTTSGDLTVEEFEDQIKELEAQTKKELQLNTIGAPAPAHIQGGCPHLAAGGAHFAHGMCKACYEEYLEVTGGTSNGADPPAFQKASQRELKASGGGEEVLALPGLEQEGDEEQDIEQQLEAVLQQDGLGKYTRALQLATAEDLSRAAAGKGKQRRQRGKGRPPRKRGATAAAEPEPVQSTEPVQQHEAGAASASVSRADRLALVAVPQAQSPADTAAASSGAAAAADEEAYDEELSDLEDDEAAMYLHTPEEAKLKELIWTELNKDFLERQSAKAAALESAAAKAAAASAVAGDDAEQQGDQAEGEPVRKRARGRPLGSKTKARPEDMLEPAETPEEATRRMLDAKKLSSKINYNVLANLFSETSRSDQDGGAGEAAASKTRSSYDRVASAGGFATGRTEARTVGGLKDGLAFRPASPRKRRVRFAPS
ncbi:probable transcription factor IIIB 90 kDa subunit at N-terminal half [Coccomyxa sp. Obi]|nr:probable transcription factor IIIB 90 kDa subunit at N-terminal half [Coccomyxa sp. Obi]